MDAALYAVVPHPKPQQHKRASTEKGRPSALSKVDLHPRANPVGMDLDQPLRPRDHREIQPPLEYRNHQSRNQKSARQCRPSMSVQGIGDSCSAHGLLELLLRGGLVRRSVPYGKSPPASHCPLVLQEKCRLLGYARCRTTQSFHPKNFAPAQETPPLTEDHARQLHAPT